MQESVAEQVVEKLWARMQTCASATRWTRTPTSARSTRAAQLARIDALVQAGVEEGAGLRQVACVLPERGFWFAPALFTEASPAHRISREEIFGPVLAVTTFRTHAEAIEKANNSPYGLAAGIWTDKGSKAFQVDVGAAGRRRLAEHLQPLRPDGGVRRVQGERLRPRGRAGRPAALRQGG